MVPELKEKRGYVMLIWEMIKAALRNEEGQGMVEYGLILALIAVVVIGVMATMGNNLSNLFTTVSGNIK